MITTSAYQIAERYIGLKEVHGPTSNPLVLGMLQLDGSWPKDDLVPWCSAFVNFIAWQLRLPRSKKLGARTWLEVGTPIEVDSASPDCDVVVITRGKGKQPGPAVIAAPGHVGFFAGVEDNDVLILGGNQSDSVSIQRFPLSRLLGVRRLA